MHRNNQVVTNGKEYRKPSERVARFILGIFEWVKDIFHSTTTTLTPGHVLQHAGRELKSGKAVRFSSILLVEDNPITAEQFTEAIRGYYIHGFITIYVAHTYGAALTYFDNEDISLVIMDADLDDDEGDGAMLTRKFFREKPDIIILANSSNKISNLKLTGFGASETLGKSTTKLQSWLLLNDPIGNRGY